ncbi:hypothetical protein RBB73_04985 [Tunturiibacter empetritectus]|uniref:Uncharacterized protein n=1 Tax=Tunturiibacter empetritectus TaxID=3069691 RepID=A0A7W8IHI0_9BACT|nr:hypothetical protein [Edaphobacter lichenicola]MBB5316358.1 hypothetical protein [Edaphobacter lichenicola]
MRSDSAALTVGIGRDHSDITSAVLAQFGVDQTEQPACVFEEQEEALAEVLCDLRGIGALGTLEVVVGGEGAVDERDQPVGVLGGG